MHTFYFNECLPAPVSEYLFSAKLTATLREFNDLYKKDIAIAPAIVTGDLPSTLSFGNDFVLHDVIENISDSVLRNFAFSVFYKYPIRAYFDEDKVELFEDEYSLALSTNIHEAVNLALIGLNDGYIFTLGLEKALCIHPLPLTIKNKPERYFLNNLFGETQNTSDIEAVIEKSNATSLSLYSQLVKLLGNCVVSLQFEKEFNSLTIVQRKSIIEYFEYAIKRNLATRFYPDTKTVSDVTPQKYKCSVYELRVYTPKALRVYFSEGDNTTYLASIGYKNITFQTEDIKKAHNIIHKMILTR